MPLGSHLGLGFFQGTALHQRLRLRQAIGHQQLVLMAQIRLVAVGGDHEFGRDDARALVDQLVKGMLAIGAGLAPDDRAGLALDRRAVQRHALAVRFHVELLQIGRKTRQALVIGQDGAGGVAQNIAMVEAEKAEQHRHVFAQRRGLEMLVHGMGAIEELAEIVRADGDHQRQADRRPDRIAAADPVPEAEDAVRVDAEGGDLVERGRDRGRNDA